MSKRLVIFALLCFSCGPIISHAQQPIELNDKLAAITDSLENRGKQWGMKLNDIAGGNKDFSELKPVRMEMQQFIDAKMKMIRNMKDVGGSEKLRQAFLDFLRFENHLVESGFIPLEKLTDKSTEQEINAAIDNLTAEAKKEEDELKKVGEEQDAYAKKNNFTVETTPAPGEQK